MNINIVRAENLDLALFEALESILNSFSGKINFVFQQGQFNEPDFWSWDDLEDAITNYRGLVGINNDDFVVFLTTSRNEFNWFSACLPSWTKNIFVSTIEWTDNEIVAIEKAEYPIAYQIVENVFQYLTSTSFDEYEQCSHEPAIGCINDMCANKKDILFKLRTADICSDCQSLAETKIEDKIYEQFIEILENIRFQFLHNKRNYDIFQKIVNKAKIDYLREIKHFVIDNLNENEKKIQDWLDEDNGKYRKQRSLIFGIDYIDPKREGEIHMRKRFDVLAEQNLSSHIIIELKSPNAKIFDIKENANENEGMTTEYSISKDLSRAIPQILSYKRWYEQMSEEQLQSLGLKHKKSVSECIIVIGQRVDDNVWKQNFNEIQKNINVKILTYNDLIDKMENTIKNFESILNQ